MIPDPVPSSRMFGDSKFLNISIAFSINNSVSGLGTRTYSLIIKSIDQNSFFPIKYATGIPSDRESIIDLNLSMTFWFIQMLSV